MYLYELPRDTGVKLKVETERHPEGEMITFHHIDGMYSLCTADEDGGYLHLAAMTPIKKENDYYVIDEPDEK